MVGDTTGTILGQNTDLLPRQLISSPHRQLNSKAHPNKRMSLHECDGINRSGSTL